MLFGASTFIWVSPFSNDTLDILSKIKELGFDYVEICVEDPRTIKTDLIKAELERVKLGALVCGAFGPNRDISSEDSSIRKIGVEYIKTCIDYAYVLGSPIVSGPMYSATGKARLLTEKEKAMQWAWAVENLKECALYAASKGIKLAIEPLNRFETDFINTVEQAMILLQRINYENVGLLLDTFHMNIEETDICEALRMAGGKIFNFHACSNTRGTPGEDHFDWTAIVETLHMINYKNPIVIESFTDKITEIAKAVSLWRPLAESQDDLAKNGLKFLKKVFA